MRYLPICVDTSDCDVLVVGGGSVAVRKIRLLRRTGARISVVAPELADDVAALERQGVLEAHRRPFEPADLNGKHLVFATTSSRDVNRRVSELCRERSLPVNVVDDPELCTFIMPAIVDRSPVVLSASTEGASPVLSRLLRARLEAMVPAAYGALARLASEYRDKVKEALPEASRRRFWEDVLEGPIGERVLAGDVAGARAELDEKLSDVGRDKPRGEVYLVGGGPGDPDLLTLRALRLMQRADVVLYDRLVSPAILDLVRRDAERIYVGKTQGQHPVPQEEINELLVALAKEGRRALRLKGGDPFIFGRGGEEIDTLADHGIQFQVVPGITAAAGCAAYAGIPLTHRDYAQSVVFATGHLKDGSINLDWRSLIQPKQTIVFYMGMHGLDVISRELQKHGLSPDLPAALVERGTRENQRVHVSTLAGLPELKSREDIRPPSLIIIGEVVSLHEKLRWFGEGRE